MFGWFSMYYYPNIGILIYVLGSLSAIILRWVGIVQEDIAVLIAVLSFIVPLLWSMCCSVKPEDDNDES